MQCLYFITGACKTGFTFMLHKMFHCAILIKDSVHASTTREYFTKHHRLFTHHGSFSRRRSFSRARASTSTKLLPGATRHCNARNSWLYSMASKCHTELEILCPTCQDIFSNPRVVGFHSFGGNPSGSPIYYHHQSFADLKVSATEYCQICRLYFSKLLLVRPKYENIKLSIRYLAPRHFRPLFAACH